MRTALALLALGFAATVVAPSPLGSGDDSDLPIYAYYADLMLAGGLPYRDFAFEYPPLAAPLLALGGVGGSGNYDLVFGVIAFLLACAVVMLTGLLAERTGGDRRTGAIAAAVALLLCGELLRSRFDLAPVALTLAALALLCSHRPRLGFAVLGLGVLVKGFPLVVAPVALAWLLLRGERRAAAQSAAVLVAIVVVVAGAGAALSVDGFGDSLRYHLDRPAQLESSPAVVLRALDGLGAGHADVEESFGSAGVRHPAARPVLAVFTGLLAGVVVLFAGAMAVGRPPGERWLVLASLGAVAAFAVFGKVLSPQFMIWVAPLTALAWVWRDYALCAALVGAHVLTLVLWPRIYGALVDGEPASFAVLATRNALLAAAVALVLVRLLSPARGSARSRWPVRLRRPRPAPR